MTNNIPKVKLSNDKLIAQRGEDILRCNVYKRTNLPIPANKQKFKYIHLLQLIEKEYCNHLFLGNLQFSTRDIIESCMDDFDINHLDMVHNKTDLKNSISSLLFKLCQLGYIELIRNRIIVDATNKPKRKRRTQNNTTTTPKRKRTKYSYSDAVIRAREERKKEKEFVKEKEKEHKLKVKETDRLWKQEQLMDQQNLKQIKLQNKIH